MRGENLIINEQTAIAPAPARVAQNNLLGIGFMVGGLFLFALMDAVAKWLVGEDLSPIQIIAIRSWMIIAILLVWLALRKQLYLLKTDRPVAHGLRGAIGFVAPFFFFLALKRLPLADATVLFFSSTFILTAFSALVFKEHVGIHRWGAVVTGFGGVLIAMNPQGGGDLSAYLMVLCATFIYTMLFLSGKHLSLRDSVISLVFSLNLMMGVVATVLLPLVWIPVSSSLVAVLLLMALLAMSGHYALTTAFSKAQVSAIAPFEYSSLIWAALLGYLLWSDIPSSRLWIGAGIIIVSGLYLVHRESLRRDS